MAGLKLKIHPLFFVVGIWYAFTGKVFIFLIYTLTALLHEMGHLFKAEKLGYAMKSVTLMPYGAVLDGSISGLKLKDEVVFALAGPALNLMVAVFFTAVWWVYPIFYVYTDTIVTANLAIGLVNLIPAYPLDGGRILYCALALRFGEEKGVKIVKTLGVFFFLLLTALFIRSIFVEINISVMVFAVFVLMGLFFNKREDSYIRLFNVSKNRIERGVMIKRYAVGTKTQLKKILALIDADCFAEITVLDEKGDKKAVFSQKQLLNILQNGSLYDEIETFIL